MSRIAGSSRDVAMDDLRRRYIPNSTTIGASALSLLPVVMSTPLVPDLGFLVLITWRLLRPEIWTAQSALGLGLIDDLLTGHPLGQSMALWTLTFLIFDLLESRIGFHDYWIDWLFAIAAIIFYTSGTWYIALLMGSDIRFSVLMPQLVISIFAYPVVARIVLGLDRWRLSR